MAVTAERKVTIAFSGDLESQNSFYATANTASPAQIQLVELASGTNTITPPSVSGIVNTAVTFIPPSGNTALVTLKGVAGDTGIPLHLTDPTTVAIDTTFTTLVLSAASTVSGFRLVWS